MLDVIFLLAVILYGASGTLFLSHLAGRSAPSSLRAAHGLLAIAGAVHLGHDVARWATRGLGPFAGIHEALSTLSLMVVGVFLVVRALQKRSGVVGALVAPLALLMLLASHATGPERARLGGALLVVHVASVLAGVAAFTVAFAMSLTYLVQERLVKQKRLGGAFHRLPPLDVLDELGYRCVALGLPALTLGIVTGLTVGARADSVTAWRQYVAMGAWALFAAVLLLRLAAGWRGRRAAIGIILGYASALVVLLGYYVRTGSP